MRFSAKRLVEETEAHVVIGLLLLLLLLLLGGGGVTGSGGSTTGSDGGSDGSTSTTNVGEKLLNVLTSRALARRVAQMGSTGAPAAVVN